MGIHVSEKTIFIDYNVDDIRGSNGDLSLLLPDNDITHTFKDAMIGKLYSRHMLTRYSQDGVVNAHGKRLLETCISSGLLIMNGRLGYDSGLGGYTRIDSTGKSVVDYMLCSPEVFFVASDFKIHNKFPESDHLPLSACINCTPALEARAIEAKCTSQWVQHSRHIWSTSCVQDLRNVMSDELSLIARRHVENTMINMSPVNEIAKALNKYMSQAADRTLLKTMSKASHKKKSLPWYDTECRYLRSESIKAGERAVSGQDFNDLAEKSRTYKACKQRKLRQYRRDTIAKIENAYNNNKTYMWEILRHTLRVTTNENVPCPDEFLDLFKDLAIGREADYFNYDYEKCAVDFLSKYDNGDLHMYKVDTLKLQIMNDNFTVSEISDVIDSLKNNKAPGSDLIPAELIKNCKLELLPVLTSLLNYIIDMRDFPEVWAEVLRSPIYKTGAINDRNNYRGITVLSVFTKIFETAVNNRISFINDAFKTTDIFNGGFLEGSRTADNIFILQGLIERQLILGKSLYICMVDFSKAFDLVNRNILFFKLIRAGFHGKVIDTLRSLYRKTVFRVKCKGLLSPPIRDSYGVNQGGNASPMLLLIVKYMTPFDENSILKYLLEPLNSHYWTTKKNLYSSCHVRILLSWIG